LFALIAEPQKRNPVNALARKVDMLNIFFIGFTVVCILGTIYNIWKCWQLQKQHERTREWFRQIDWLIYNASKWQQNPDLLRMRMISIREQMGHKQAERTGINELIGQLERM